MDNLLSPAATSTMLMSANQNQHAIMEAASKAQQARTGDVQNLEEIEKTAKDFEAVFVSEMMKPMFEGIEVNSMFGGGKGEEVFRGMMLQEYGKMIADTGSIGLSDSIKQKMIEMQAQANNTTENLK